MTDGADRSAAPVGTRLVHAAVFVAIAGLGLAATEPEWAQLLEALRRPYHFGAPPDALALAAGAVCAALGVALLVRFARHQRNPLWLSAAILAAALVGFWATHGEPPPGRSWAAADREILEVARKLDEKMIEGLQAQGGVSPDLPVWQAALVEAADEPSPARTRDFRRIPYQLRRVDAKGALPSPLVPGMILLWVSPDDAAFELTPIGFGRDGAVAPLTDDKGARVVLRGTYNPDLAGPLGR